MPLRAPAAVLKSQYKEVAATRGRRAYSSLLERLWSRMSSKAFTPKVPVLLCRRSAALPRRAGVLGPRLVPEFRDQRRSPKIFAACHRLPIHFVMSSQMVRTKEMIMIPRLNPPRRLPSHAHHQCSKTWRDGGTSLPARCLANLRSIASANAPRWLGPKF